MFTGYFAKLKTYKENGLIPVAICGKSPDWYDGLQYRVLAPKWGFFNEWKNGNHKGDNDYYVEHFQSEVLDGLKYDDVVAHLSKLGDLEKIILICYEKPCDFCHRHLVADWLKKNGLDCEEWIQK